MDGRLSITEVAKFIGVTPRTIMRWEKTGKIKRSKRDWRGWRFYMKDDLEEIRKFYESSYEYEGGGKTFMDLTKAAVNVLILVLSLAAVSIIGLDAYAANGTGGGAVSESASSVDINLNKLPVVVPPPANIDEAMKYTLGPDDVIEIEVRRHPEFSGQYTVNSEGKIEYKFVGDINVRGLTKAQFKEKLASILSEYIVEPDVDARIVAYLSKVFYVVGEVNAPGKFYMKGDTIPVREALVQAGLPNGAASLRKCRIISPAERGKVKTRYVNIYELLYGGDLKENVEMNPGDVLYIPSTVIAKIIRVISPVTDFASETAGHAVQGAGIAATL